MPIRLAINGYGRIGRCLLRALYESPLIERLQIVLINEPTDLDSMVYLTRFDSTHGRFRGRVESTSDSLLIDGIAMAVTHATSPIEVPWRDVGVDLLLECSGCYSRRHELERFLAAGCPRVMLSHPGHSADDVCPQSR